MFYSLDEQAALFLVGTFTIPLFSLFGHPSSVSFVVSLSPIYMIEKGVVSLRPNLIMSLSVIIILSLWQLPSTIYHIVTSLK